MNAVSFLKTGGLVLTSLLGEPTIRTGTVAMSLVLQDVLQE